MSSSSTASSSTSAPPSSTSPISVFFQRASTSKHDASGVPRATKMSLITKVKAVLLTILALINSLYGCAVYMVLFALGRPLMFISERLFWQYEEVIFGFTLSLLELWLACNRFKIVETGAWIGKGHTTEVASAAASSTENNPTNKSISQTNEVYPGSVFSKRALVMANHQETGDLPVLGALMSAHGIGGESAWIYDSMFNVTHFGAICVIRGDAHVTEGKNTRDQSLERIKQKLGSNFVPRLRKWCVFFPEGGLLFKRRESSQRYAKKMNLPVLTHIALPKDGAFKASLSALEGAIDGVVDITIGFAKDDPLSLLGLVSGTYQHSEIAVHYRFFDIKSIPVDDAKRTEWLIQRFVEKERLLEYFYKHGEFNETAALASAGAASVATVDNPKNILKYNYLKHLLINIYFLFATYTFWKGLSFAAVFIFNLLWSMFSV